jgi:hypothetical protein
VSRRDRSRASNQFVHLGHQILRLGAPDRLAGYQNDVGTLNPLRRRLSPGFAQDAPSSVPLHGAADAARGDEGGVPRAGRDEQYHQPSVRRPALGEDPADVAGAHRQADKVVRPLERRRAMIARPARVRMRLRKPCFFARRRLFGW